MIKKIILVLIAIIVLLLGAAIVIPIAYKDKIITRVKDEINKTINAKVDFGAIDLTIIKSFPSLTFTLNNLSVVGVEEFNGDTLAAIKALELKLNVWDVIRGSNININSIQIYQPYFNIIVLPDGKANYDIIKPSEGTASSESSAFKISLKKYDINQGRINYNDMSLGYRMQLSGINHSGKGDFTESVFELVTKTAIDNTNIWYGGVKYLNKVKTVGDVNMIIDMLNFKFTFKENEVKLNDLALAFDGWMAMPKDDINMDMTWKVKQNDFKSFISLLPGVYSDSFKDVQSSGSLAMNGFVKGTYNDNLMPGFGLVMNVSNGQFKYPSLPSSVNNVQIDLSVNNSTGVPDNTTINLKQLHVELGQEPFDMKLVVTTPVSNANIDMMMKGRVNLDNVKNYIPLENGTALSGLITSDLSFKGRYNDIEQKQYDKFEAKGSLSLSNMKYESSGDVPVLINNMQLVFTPRFVSLNDFSAQMGRSNIQARGNIDNLLGYYFKDELLKGTFSLSSTLLDLNEYMTGSISTGTAPDTTTLSVIEVPGNIDFTLNSSIKKILYDNLDIQNLNGALVVRDNKIDMRNLTFDIIGGQVKMSGTYATVSPTKPTYSYNLGLSNFDIQQAAKTFNTVKQLAPIAERTQGKANATLNVDGLLSENMQPKMNTLNGAGKVIIKGVNVSNFEPANKIADAIKMNEFKQLQVGDAEIAFEIKDGRIVVKPFETALAGSKATIEGSSGLDQSIDYKINIAIPKYKLGAQANQVISAMFSKLNTATGTTIQLPDPVKINIKIGGTLLQPKITTDLAEQGSNVTQQVKEEIKEHITQKVEQTIDNAKQKAKEQADKILAEAEIQAKQIRNAAKAAADKIRAEGYAAADKVVAEAKNPIAKVAAQETAKKMKQETDKKAQSIIDEGNKNAQKVLDEARKKADDLLK